MTDTDRWDSQRNAHTGVFEAHREDALVDLMELHQLQEVNEQRQAIIHGVVLPAAVFTLQTERVGVRAIQRDSRFLIGPGSDIQSKGRELTGITR